MSAETHRPRGSCPRHPYRDAGALQVTPRQERARPRYHPSVVEVVFFALLAARVLWVPSEARVEAALTAVTCVLTAAVVRRCERRRIVQRLSFKS